MKFVHDGSRTLLLFTDDPTAIPTLTTAVPREYVHKRALAEVLLTDLRPDGEDAFVVTAQWPRRHSFFTSEDGRYRSLLFVETVRQTFPLLSHAAFDVPFGHHLIWRHLDYTLDPCALAIGDRPGEVELRIRCRDLVRRGGRMASVALQITATLDGHPLGVADTAFTAHVPAVYRRLRGTRADMEFTSPGTVPPPPVPAWTVSRDHARDVVLAATETSGRWSLRVDRDDPVHFDHPVDHVPGALLLEAVGQAAHAVAGGGVHTGTDAVFTRFAELDAPCWIEAEPSPGTGPGAVRVVVRQGGEEVLTAVARLDRVPETEPAPALA